MVCQICGSQKNQIPAGVSKKTGKSYNAFWACPNKCNQTQAPQPTYTAPKVWDNRPSAQKTEPNWEDINFGKCKHAFLVESYKAIVQGKLAMDITKEHDKDLLEKGAEEWATMSMRKLPKEAPTEPQYEEPPF